MVAEKPHIRPALSGAPTLLLLISLRLMAEGAVSPEEAPVLLSDANVRRGFVSWVVDGDTIMLKGGETLRYVGVDTPEKGRPFYKEAQRRNIEIVKGRAVTFVVCAEEPRDKYGRTLAWVWAGTVPVNEVLLKEGLAKTLVIPPCGLKRKKEYEKLESDAKARRIGIWGLKR